MSWADERLVGVGGLRRLELLEAQGTVDDVYLGYAGALADPAKALVALERATIQHLSGRRAIEPRARTCDSPSKQASQR